MSEGSEREQWAENSRRLNVRCGCDQRGNRLFLCKYHEGADDGWDAAEEVTAKRIVRKLRERRKTIAEIAAEYGLKEE